MKSFLLVALLVVIIGTCAYGQIKVDNKRKLLIDEYGRYRIYHGVNTIYKPFPFYPPILEGFQANNSLSELDFQNLTNWGFNFIRLYVSWEGVEPQRGQYNLTYLNQIKKIVQMAAKYNVQVLLDAHQDLLSRSFCGEGMPPWAAEVVNFPHPLPYKMEFQDGIPEMEYCLKHEFGTYYASMDVGRNFERLFNNVDGIADSFAQMWGVVAQNFKDEPNVLGYEIINEPFGSSPYDKPWQLLDCNNIYLLPFYTKVNTVIRQYDQQKLVFFEPALADLLGLGFKSIPGGEEYKDREVFSYHIYCPFVNKQGVPTSKLACRTTDWLQVKSKVHDAEKLDITGFMTEFGALNNSTGAADEIAYVTQQAENYFHSWSYWQFKYFQDYTTAARPGTTESFWDIDGNLNTLKLKALSRPYAYAICGNPLKTNFDMHTGKFELSFEASSCGSNMQTEFYISEQFYYQQGYEFKCNVGCQLQASNQYSYYTLILPSTVSNGQKVEIEILPKSN